VLALSVAIVGGAAWCWLRDANVEGAGAAKRTNEVEPASLVGAAHAASADAAERTKEQTEPAASANDAAPGANENDGNRTGTPASLRDFHVHVFDEADGRPIANATVLLSAHDAAALAHTMTDWGPVPALRTHDGSEPVTERARGSTRTGADGRAVLPVPADGSAVVDVLAKECVPAYVDVRGERGTAARPLEIGLSRTASLRGTVVDPLRKPIAGVAIAVRFDRAGLQRPRPAFGSMFDAGVGVCEVTTDSNGAFEFRGLPPDVELDFHTTTNERYWLGRSWLWLDPGEERSVEWTLSVGTRIHGRVVGEDGSAVERAAVLVSGGSGLFSFSETDASGEFTLDDVPPGSVALRADPLDDVHASATLALDIGADAPPADVVVRLPVAAPLFVRALDPDGNVHKPAEVHVFPFVNVHPCRDPNHARDVAEGTSRSEASPYTLVCVPLGDLVLRVVPPLTTTWSAVETTFHHDGKHECVVQFGAGGRLAGTIVDAGDPATRVAAAVTIRRRDAARAFAAETTMQSTVEPGTFQFDGVGAGEWDVLARSDDGRIGVASGVRLGAGEPLRSIVVEVAAGATLELVAPDSAATTETLVAMEPAIRFEARRDGAFVGAAVTRPFGRASLPVPPGRIVVEVVVGGAVVATREVEARAGEWVRVRF
jgi:protocatechuate 3,4-dioxygenase beta subunit